MVENWKRPHLKEKLDSKVLYEKCEDKCFKLTAERLEDVNELRMVQQEADTRMLLHTKHAAADYYSIIIIVADDTY